jgi:hypothetical protein
MKKNATNPAAGAASPRDRQAAHSHDPLHRYHDPAVLRDARPAVARSGAAQRIRAHRPGSKTDQTPSP